MPNFNAQNPPVSANALFSTIQPCGALSREAKRPSAGYLPTLRNSMIGGVMMMESEVGIGMARGRSMR